MALVLITEKRSIGKIDIDDVQEVGKRHTTKIPNRFVRDIHERPLIIHDHDSSHHQIPVIDLSKISSGAQLLQLSAACQDWGFFQVISYLFSLYACSLPR